MLTLIFNRAAKRRIVGLLALGGWGPATGAISGSVSTEQARQETLAGGTVLEPIETGIGRGGFSIGPWVRPRPHFTLKIPAITGACETRQGRQESLLTGDMIDTELEMLTAILLQIA
jgi:hypothetical protein